MPRDCSHSWPILRSPVGFHLLLHFNQSNGKGQGGRYGETPKTLKIIALGGCALTMSRFLHVSQPKVIMDQKKGFWKFLEPLLESDEVDQIQAFERNFVNLLIKSTLKCWLREGGAPQEASATFLFHQTHYCWGKYFETTFIIIFFSNTCQSWLPEHQGTHMVSLQLFCNNQVMSSIISTAKRCS